MTNKIQTLGESMLAKHASPYDNGYASAYGMMRGLVELMLADLPADKRASYERLIDGLIAENS